MRGQDAIQHIGEIMCEQALINHLNLHLLLVGQLDREQKVILQIRLTMPTSLGGSSVFEEKRQTTDSVGCWVLVFYEYPTTVRCSVRYRTRSRLRFFTHEIFLHADRLQLPEYAAYLQAFTRI